jgi:hypothetical protein
MGVMGAVRRAVHQSEISSNYQLPIGLNANEGFLIQN